MLKKVLIFSIILSPLFACSDPQENTSTVQDAAPPTPMPGGELAEAPVALESLGALIALESLRALVVL